MSYAPSTQSAIDEITIREAIPFCMSRTVNMVILSSIWQVIMKNWTISVGNDFCIAYEEKTGGGALCTLLMCLW